MTKVRETPPPDGDDAIDEFAHAYALRFGELALDPAVRDACDAAARDPRCEHGRSIYDVHHDCAETA